MVPIASSYSRDSSFYLPPPYVSIRDFSYRESMFFKASDPRCGKNHVNAHFCLQLSILDCFSLDTGPGLGW